MFSEVSFHDGPTQKSIKQRPDKCSQPEPPARPGQRPGSSPWQTGWARKLKTDHFLAKMHTVIEHFHQNCTIMPKNCAEIESRNWEKVVFFPVGETLQESKAFRFLFPDRQSLAGLDQLGQANGGVKVWSEDHCIRTNNTIFISI